MTERNDRILSNRAEVLRRRKAQLLREIADGEAELAQLSAEYDRRLAHHRSRALLDAAVPVPSKNATETGPQEREAFREAFRIGLICSLLIGLMIVFGIRR
jgi:hypothetical protein